MDHPPATFLESIRSTLLRMMAEDASVIVLGEDVLDPYGGAFKATRGLSTRFPGRVFTTPISEASIVGIAVGLALRGMHPIAEIMFGDFVTLAADQLINHAAKYQAMYNRATDVPMVIRTPMGGGRGYGPTHSQSLEKLFLGLPDLTILAPSHFHDPGKLLELAVQGHQPTLFIEEKLLYSTPLNLDGGSGKFRQTILPDDAGFPVVTVKNYPPVKRPDLAIAAYGGASRLVEPVLIELAGEEIWVTACFPSRLNPFDAAPVLASLDGCRRIIVIEEGPPEFGWGAEVAAKIYEARFSQLEAPIKRIGAEMSVIPASRVLEEQVILTKEKILSAVFEVLKW